MRTIISESRPPRFGIMLRVRMRESRNRRENSGSASGNNCVRRSLPRLLERGKRGERTFVRRCGLRRLEYRSGLAGIWIEPEDEEFGGDRAKIDQPVYKRVRSLPVLL